MKTNTAHSYQGLRRTAILATIGGGAVGLMACYTLASEGAWKVWWFDLVLALAVAYVIWGFVIGIGIAEGRVRYKQLVTWLAVQIPCVSSPILGIRVAMGPQLIVGHFEGDYVIRAYPIIGELAVHVWGDYPWELAINAVPAALIIWLMRARANSSIRSEPIGTTAPGE
jgi:hypothetical protein